MSSDRRLVEWFDLVGDLLQRPQAEFPVEPIALQLTRTFRVRAVAWDWRRDSGPAGYMFWPSLDHATLDDADMLRRHPLLRWFVLTQDTTPQTTARVPDPFASRRDRAMVEDYLKPHGIEHQLSMPCLLAGKSYETFILSRADDDFDDHDLDLARHLHVLVTGLYLRTATLDRHHPQAGTACRAADRAGLTATELAVLVLLAEGHTTHGIAVRLSMAPRTTSKHLEHIYRKLGVSHRLAAVLAAQEAGLVMVDASGT